MVPLIVKRDSRLELYDPNKIVRVSKAAGLTDEQSTKLVDTLSKWLHSLSIEQLHSTKLRDKMIQEMHLLNQNAAKMFTWYQKTKEK
jgi:transcriptional regulator NrdR family protein